MICVMRARVTLAEAGEFGVVADLARLDQALEPQCERHQPGDARHTAEDGRRWGGWRVAAT